MWAAVFGMWSERRGVLESASRLDRGVMDRGRTDLYPQSFFDMATTRLSLPLSRMYGSTNPGPPRHYLKTDYLDNPELRHKRDVWSGAFRPWTDNPNIDEKTKERYRRMYTGVFKLRYIDGLWVAAEGAIYRDCFTDDLLFDDSTRPIGLYGPGGAVARYIGIDYGTVNPMVFLEILDDGKTLWVIREYYWDSKKEMRQKSDAEYLAAFQRWISESPVKDDRLWPLCVVDPSAASFKVALTQAGFIVEDGENDVLEGIRKVSTMFSRKLVRVHRQCLNTIAEHQEYSWNDKKSQNGEEAPIKQHDHTCDAKRMVIHTKINDWRLAA